MALNDRFAANHAQAASADYCLQRSPVKNEATSVNRKLVQEMAYRPSVIEALKKERSILGRFGRKQERVDGTIKSRLYFRNKYRNLSVHDRLGYVKEKGILHRRHYRSGVSPLIRDQLEFQEPDDFEKYQLNQTENVSKKDYFEEKRQSSDDDICVEVNIHESEPKIDLDDIHFKIKFNPNQPRAYPTGIFNFYHGIRYYGSEIFIWVTECSPIDQP